MYLPQELKRGDIRQNNRKRVPDDSQKTESGYQMTGSLTHLTSQRGPQKFKNELQLTGQANRDNNALIDYTQKSSTHNSQNMNTFNGIHCLLASHQHQ